MATEALRPTEQFPKVEEGGVLIFCVYADEEKLASLLSTGIKPRGGPVRAASFFPNVVSLGVVASYRRGRELEDAMESIFPSLIINTRFDPDHPANFTPHYRYAFILDPLWVGEHIREFVGVGESVCSKRLRPGYRTGTLKDLPIQPLKTDGLIGPLYHEVHYRGGTLPNDALKGAVIDEERSKLVYAGETLKKAVARVRQTDTPLPNLAAYFSTGRLLKVL